MLARTALQFYRLVHHVLGVPGAGFVLRRAARIHPALRSAPLTVPGVGTATIDLRDDATYTLLNFALGEADDHRHLIDWMVRAVPPGGVIWDVGANVGMVSAALTARLGPSVTIHAFEPVPAPRRTLQSLFADHPSVHVHAFGLGDRAEHRTIQLIATGSALSSLTRSLEGAASLEIDLERGDTLCAQRGWPVPDLIKIDVEGFEPEVFAGLQETIATKRPAIFFEHILLDPTRVRALVPDGYALRFLSSDGSLIEAGAWRGGGHNAVLLVEGHPLLG